MSTHIFNHKSNYLLFKMHKIKHPVMSSVFLYRRGRRYVFIFIFQALETIIFRSVDAITAEISRNQRMNDFLQQI